MALKTGHVPVWQCILGLITMKKPSVGEPIEREKSTQSTARTTKTSESSLASGNGEPAQNPDSRTVEPAGKAESADNEQYDEKPKKKSGFFTWERSIEILKLLATVWVAVLGSLVTMQFNERQHELNRIEAIAQMLPHMSAQSKPGESSLDRDGAMWAIFRTASNRTMLRDLAALFPQDIYRVVASIAQGGELTHDADALVALQVASEKLAAKYATDPKHAELANRLYAQAAKLKERTVDDQSPLQIIDLSAEVPTMPTDDRWGRLIQSINDLADAHLKESGAGRGQRKNVSGEWEATTLYQRGRQLGLTNSDCQVQQQVIRADLSLAAIYVKEQLSDDAFKYLKEALQLESKITKQPYDAHLKALDKDGDGFAGLPEMGEAIKVAQERLKQIMVQYKDRGAPLSEESEEAEKAGAGK